MSRTWLHEIGVFTTDDGTGWKTRLPSVWPDLRNPPKEDSSVAMVLDSEGPEHAAVEQLNLFWAARDSFPCSLFKYVFSDLQGELDSGNWWSESDEPVVLSQRALGEAPLPIASPERLAGHLELAEIVVTYVHEVSGEPLTVNPFTGEPIEASSGHAPIARPGGFWAVYCGFNCGWEKEHGLGVTWRNGLFIGIGYADGPLVDKNYQPE